MSQVCKEHNLLRCGTCGEIECLEKTISQQAEIIKILKEACEYYGNYYINHHKTLSDFLKEDTERFDDRSILPHGKRARHALAQVEKLKGEVR